MYRTPANYLLVILLRQKVPEERSSIYYRHLHTKRWLLPKSTLAEPRFEPSFVRLQSLRHLPPHCAIFWGWLVSHILYLLSLFSFPSHLLPLHPSPSPPSLWKELGETGHWPWSQADQSLTLACAGWPWTSFWTLLSLGCLSWKQWWYWYFSHKLQPKSTLPNAWHRAKSH